jgi:hypothetical protein
MRAIALGSLVVFALLSSGRILAAQTAPSVKVGAEASSAANVGTLSPNEARRAARARQRAAAKFQAIQENTTRPSAAAVSARATAKTEAAGTSRPEPVASQSAMPVRDSAPAARVAARHDTRGTAVARPLTAAADARFGRYRSYAMRRRLAARRIPRIGDVVPPDVALMPLPPGYRPRPFTRETAMDVSRGPYNAMRYPPDRPDLPPFPEIDDR